MNAYSIPGLKEYKIRCDTPEEIICVVCNYLNADYDMVVNKHKGANKFKYYYPRSICMYMLREKIKIGGREMTLKDIGKLFAGRDHTTVLSAIRLVNDQLSLKYENAYKKDIEKLKKMIE